MSFGYGTPMHFEIWWCYPGCPGHEYKYLMWCKVKKSIILLNDLILFLIGESVFQIDVMIL